MWHVHRIAGHGHPEFVASAAELIEGTSRKLLYLTGGAYLAWHILATTAWPRGIGPTVWFASMTTAPLFLLAWWLLPRRLAWAQGIWLLWLTVAISLHAHLLAQPALIALSMVLPLMAAVTFGLPAAIGMEGMVAGLTAWQMGNGMSPVLGAATVIGGAWGGVTGWIASDAFVLLVHWSLSSYLQAQRHAAEAFDQRLVLQQTQQDLLQANRELARLSDRLKALHRVAEEARRAKEEFVANVSHELRTPLNMIIGFSEMITESPHVYGAMLPAALLTDIAAIKRNSEHLARLVDDVLDLSQIEAGRMVLNPEWVSLAEIVQEAALAVGVLYTSKGLSLQCHVPPDLPRIYVDGTRIRQVLLNLLSNAGRFTERGGVTVEVVRQDHEVVISVRDTGPGIARDDQGRLFEPFQQLDGSIRRQHSGSGLGLSISRRFVEMHGGRMWLESELGVGTTFYFSLPIDGGASGIVGAEETEREDARRWFNPYEAYEYRLRTRPSLAPKVKPGPRYLILEEGDHLQRKLARYLTDGELQAVRTPEEATRELARAPAQAVLINAPLDEGDAWRWEQFADLPFETPAMICSVPAEDTPERRLGIARYLTKPITREALEAALSGLGCEVRTILLVDDEPEVLQLFARMLASFDRGYQVLRARSGQRALTLLRERRPDVMILDLIMPGMDGFQVLQEKARDETLRAIPVIVITSRDAAGEPVVSKSLTIVRKGGLSVPDLAACLRGFSEILTPGRSLDPTRPGSRRA
jgi:signal transduction histidine kinase/CheY-like chemotaxis protein